MYNSKWCNSQHKRLWMAMESFLLFMRKHFCSCVWPVTLIYCVKMVTSFFSFVCQKPKYRMLVYICYSVNFVKLQCTCIVLAPLILLMSCKIAFTVSFCISFNFVRRTPPPPPPPRFVFLLIAVIGQFCVELIHFTCKCTFYLPFLIV